MPINILMPALSPTMEKGNLAKWLKKEGDKVKSGDVIAEIETDKATMEVEAVDEGTLAKIVVPEGTADVPVNQVIAVLAGEGEDVKAAAPARGKAPRRRRSRRQPRRRASSPAPLPNGRGAASPLPAPAPRLTAPQAAPAPRPERQRAHVRLAAGAAARQGSRHRSVAHRRAPARTAASSRATSTRRNRARACKRAGAAAAAPRHPPIAPAMSDEQVRALFEEGSYEVVPHDGMRRIIAQRLTQSKQTIPHFYLTLDCNIDKLLAAREEINAAAPKDKDGKPAYKLSVNDFVIKALALALQRVPDANVTWTESGMLKHKHSDVGVAVAIPGGLITPIIRHAETQVAVGDLQRDEGSRRARPRAQAQAAGIPGRHHRGVQPRHVRHQGLRRRDQPAARHHPGGRRRRGAGGRAGTARSRPRT